MMTTDYAHNAISSILKNVDFADIADDMLARINLKRRRPGISALSTVALLGLGAAGAFAVVAFVPAVREALTDDPVRKLREAMDDVIGATEDAAHDAEHAVKRKVNEAKESARSALKTQSRPTNGNKLDV